ncbi:MAG: hypothetical protein ACYDGR_14610 [Candidatus Dormibacteria bacterium]
MAVKTKPIRLFTADEAPLSLLAQVEGRSKAEVLHAALVEYLHNHRRELSDVFGEAQRALAAGDLDGLTRVLSADAEHRADLLADEIAKLR